MKIVIKDTDETRRDILKRGINMTQFAVRVDITKAYFSDVLNGKRFPSPALAKRIADEIGKPIQEVFNFE